MFQFVDDKRRITTFIKAEAYKWLFKHLEKYKPRGREAEDLYMNIQRESVITETTYNKLIDLFENNPFTGTIKGLSYRKPIIADDIYMYFIKYNGAVLPLGFIFDFFEDDYGEADKDKERSLINDFLSNAKREIRSEWEGTKFNARQNVENTISSLTNIKNFNAVSYIKYVSWVVCLLVLALSIHYFYKTYDVGRTFRAYRADNEREMSNIIDFSLLDTQDENGDGIAANNSESELSPILLLNDPYSLSQYILVLIIPLVFNCIALMYIILNIKNIIAKTILVTKVSITKIKLKNHLQVAENCIKEGGNKMESFLSDLIKSYDHESRTLSFENVSESDVEEMFVQLNNHNNDLKNNQRKYNELDSKLGKNAIHINKGLIVFTIIVVLANQPFIANFMYERFISNAGLE